MDTKRELKPRRSLNGKSLRKSSACFLEVRIARSVMSHVTEKHSPTNEAMANTLNAGYESQLTHNLKKIMNKTYKLQNYELDTTITI
ncbi:hypothetical protein SESBI_43442 [Sesbania bispinosa]|nr:hypothetical protein SESBI_43442 [Sesbania bispinosa]